MDALIYPPAKAVGPATPGQREAAATPTGGGATHAIVARAEPARHGDSLIAKPLPQLNDYLDPETLTKVGAACRNMGLQFQARGDRRSSYYFYEMARIFRA